MWWPGLEQNWEIRRSLVQHVRIHHQSRSFTRGSGPYLGKHFFVIVDAHFKWIEAAVVSSPSSQQAMQVLRHTFATHGLPDILVSDNDTAFTSAEFQFFVKAYGF